MRVCTSTMQQLVANGHQIDAPVLYNSDTNLWAITSRQGSNGYAVQRYVPYVINFARFSSEAKSVIKQVEL